MRIPMQKTNKLFSLLFILLISFTLSTFPQDSGNDRLLEMKNAFVVGLIDKGLEIGIELMSRSEYSSVREDATFYIAELFFLSAISSEESNTQVEYASKSYTYYLVLNNDYPNSQYNSIISSRIDVLTTFYSEYIEFRNRLDPLLNESSIVAKKLDLATQLYSFVNPNPYTFFLEGELEQSSVAILDRYFDEIIINYPEFEIYAYYLKILSRLSTIDGIKFFKDGILDFEVDKVIINLIAAKNSGSVFKAGLYLKNELSKMLAKLDIKYSHHPLLLNMHLIFAKVFMAEYGGKIDSDTKFHLEFVVQNEKDKTHPRYLLAKEFLLNNKFR